MALALYFEVKFLRVDWISRWATGSQVRPRRPTFPDSWRTLADTSADLLPRQLVRVLTEVAVTVDRMDAEMITMNDVGVADLRAMAARAERDLAAIVREPFDAATAEWLERHQAQFGDKPEPCVPPACHRCSRRHFWRA